MIDKYSISKSFTGILGITREKWLMAAVEDIDTFLFYGKLDLFSKTYQVGIGPLPQGMKSMSYREDEQCSSNAVISIQLSWEIDNKIELLTVLAYECIKAFFPQTIDKKMHKMFLDKYYFDSNTHESSDYLRKLMEEVYAGICERVGDYPGQTVCPKSDKIFQNNIKPATFMHPSYFPKQQENDYLSYEETDESSNDNVPQKVSKKQYIVIKNKVSYKTKRFETFGDCRDFLGISKPTFTKFKNLEYNCDWIPIDINGEKMDDEDIRIYMVDKVTPDTSEQVQIKNLKNGKITDFVSKKECREYLKTKYHLSHRVISDLLKYGKLKEVSNLEVISINGEKVS